MLKYELSDKLRRAMAKDEPAVKAALCAIANARFGKSGTASGIGKFEGGVRVNGREIVIKEGLVADDWNRSGASAPEELAVVEAIAEVGHLVRKKGIAAVRATYGECRTGDPLRGLLKL